MQTICLLGTWLALSMFISLDSFAVVYKKSTEGRDVVKSKMYPKRDKIEFNIPSGGLFFNQAYINTYLLNVGVTYFISENWGIGIDATLGSNSDKTERTCIENFYLAPEDQPAEKPVGVCSLVDGDSSGLEGVDSNNNDFPRFGPAYVPIREVNSMVIANFVWTPVYGKQLIFMSNTSYFDLFVEMGLGVASSTFYRKLDYLRNGNTPRSGYLDDSDGTDEAIKQQNYNIGASISDTDSYGIAGRPDPEDQTNVLLNLGIGQKFHFGKLFHLKVSLRNQTLLGTPQGFDNLLSILVGAGFRL